MMTVCRSGCSHFWFDHQQPLISELLISKDQIAFSFFFWNFPVFKFNFNSSRSRSDWLFWFSLPCSYAIVVAKSMESENWLKALKRMDWRTEGLRMNEKRKGKFATKIDSSSSFVFCLHATVSLLVFFSPFCPSVFTFVLSSPTSLGSPSSSAVFTPSPPRLIVLIFEGQTNDEMKIWNNWRGNLHACERRNNEKIHTYNGYPKTKVENVYTYNIYGLKFWYWIALTEQRFIGQNLSDFYIVLSITNYLKRSKWHCFLMRSN